MAHEGESVGAAVGLPQLLPVHIAGEIQVFRRRLHHLPDIGGYQTGVRPAVPDEADGPHPPGQIRKFGQSLAGDGVAHGDHGFLSRPQPSPLAERFPQRRIGGKKVRVHAVGNGVYRSFEAVALQQMPGVLRGSQHHVPQAVAEGDPPPEQRGQGVGAPEGMAEVLHGGVAVADHLPPRQPGPEHRRQNVRQHCVDVDGPGVAAPAVRGLHARPAQHLPLVADGLSHAAFGHQVLAAAVYVNPHAVPPYGSLCLVSLRPAWPSRAATPPSAPGCT